VQSETKGFFGSLFDISFSSLITTKIIKVLYVLTLILIGLGYVFFTISAFAADSGAGALVLFIVGPILSLFYVVYARVFLEIVIALFRIMESNVEIAGLLRSGGSPAPAATPGPASPAAPQGDAGA
jgi:hypothetical protein